MKDMLSADHVDLLAWVVERDIGEGADYRSISPALVYNVTQAHVLADELGADYEAMHPDLDIKASKSWMVIMMHLRRCGIIGLPVYHPEHWTLLGQLVVAPTPNPQAPSSIYIYNTLQHFPVPSWASTVPLGALVQMTFASAFLVSWPDT